MFKSVQTAGVQLACLNHLAACTLLFVTCATALIYEAQLTADVGRKIICYSGLIIITGAIGKYMAVVLVYGVLIDDTILLCRNQRKHNMLLFVLSCLWFLPFVIGFIVLIASVMPQDWRIYLASLSGEVATLPKIRLFAHFVIAILALICGVYDDGIDEIEAKQKHDDENKNSGWRKWLPKIFDYIFALAFVAIAFIIVQWYAERQLNETRESRAEEADDEQHERLRALDLSNPKLLGIGLVGDVAARVMFSTLWTKVHHEKNNGNGSLLFVVISLQLAIVFAVGASVVAVVSDDSEPFIPVALLWAIPIFVVQYAPRCLGAKNDRDNDDEQGWRWRGSDQLSLAFSALCAAVAAGASGIEHLKFAIFCWASGEAVYYSVEDHDWGFAATWQLVVGIAAALCGLPNLMMTPVAVALLFAADVYWYFRAKKVAKTPRAASITWPMFGVFLVYGAYGPFYAGLFALVGIVAHALSWSVSNPSGRLAYRMVLAASATRAVLALAVFGVLVVAFSSTKEYTFNGKIAVAPNAVCGGYRLCDVKWHNEVNVRHLAYLAGSAYLCGEDFSEDIQKGLWDLSGKQWRVKYACQQDFMQLQYGVARHTNPTKIAVVFVRGTADKADWLINALLWGEAVVSRLTFWWDLDSVREFVRVTSSIGVMRAHRVPFCDKMRKEVQDLVAHNFSVILTGHSLGGGVAKLIAAVVDSPRALAVAFNPPGISIASAKIGIESAKLDNQKNVNCKLPPFVEHTNHIEVRGFYWHRVKSFRCH